MLFKNYNEIGKKNQYLIRKIQISAITPNIFIILAIFLSSLHPFQKKKLVFNCGNTTSEFLESFCNIKNYSVFPDEAEELVNPMGIGKKMTQSGSTKLFVTAHSKSGSDSDVTVVENYGHDNHELDRTKWPLRKCHQGTTQPLYAYLTTLLT